MNQIENPDKWPFPLLRDWEAKSKEDKLLERYCNKNPGMFLVEIPIGGGGSDLPWDDTCTTRRLDAVKILGYRDGKGIYKYPFKKNELARLFRGKRVEVIEVKQKLNRPVIGQAIAGRAMFKRRLCLRMGLQRTRDQGSGVRSSVILSSYVNIVLNWGNILIPHCFFL